MKKKKDTAILFAALPVSEPVREAAVHLQNALRLRTEGSYPVRENLHVTLAYLGEVPRGRMQEAADIVASVAAPECRLVFDRMLRWKGQGDMFVYAAEAPESLRAYRTAIHAALLKHRFSVEDSPFTPHITLVRGKKRGVDIQGIEPNAAVMVSGPAVLFESVHLKGGRHYIPVSPKISEKEG